MLSLEEARKILGEKYKHLTDKEIESIIVLVYNLCKTTILEVTGTKHV